MNFSSKEKKLGLFIVLLSILILFYQFSFVLAAEGDEDITFWNKTYDAGTLGNDLFVAIGDDVAIDSFDNIYTIGSGTRLISATTVSDVWIRKHFPNGSEDLNNWNKSVSSVVASSDVARGIAIDSQNNIYIGMQLSNNTNDTTQRNEGAFNWVLRRFNISGSENATHWNKTFDLGSSEALYAIAIDSFDDLYAVGYGTNLVGANSQTDWWVKKIYSNGTEDIWNWNKSFDSHNTADIAYDVAVDTNNNVYVVGKGINLTSDDSGTDWWIKVFNSSGTENLTNWNKSYSSNHSYNSGINCNLDEPYSVETDSANNIIIAGIYCKSTSQRDGWLKKFFVNGSEDITWNKTLGTRSNLNDVASAVAIDSYDSVYVALEMRFSQFTNSLAAVLKKFNSSGFEDVTLWNRSYDLGSGTEAGYGVAVDSKGNVTFLLRGSNLLGDGTTVSGTDWWIKKFQGVAPNYVPAISVVYLNTTSLTSNSTNDNLTVYANATDADLTDSIKFIYNWLVGNSRIAVLNMPFERINRTSTSNTWDYSGYENNGSENGAIAWNLSGGHDGKGSYEFNGIDTFINVSFSESLSFNFTNKLTVATWIKYKARPSNTSGIIGRWRAPTYPFLIWMNGAGNISFVINNSNYLYTPIPEPDKWYFLTGVYNGTQISLYVNGSLVSSAAQTGNIANHTVDLLIGTFSNDGVTYSYFNGTIDDILLLNRSLSSSQIYALYRNQTSIITADETSTSENWSVQVTPNDGTEDGQMVTSNNVTVLDATVSDTTAPLVSIVNPASNNTNYSTGNILFNATIAEANIGAVNFSFDNATGIDFNVTVTNASGTYSTTQAATVFTEGRQQVMRVFATDTSGNLNSSTSGNFTIDRTSPNVTLNFLNNFVNGSNFSINSNNQTFNVSVFDTFTEVSSVNFTFDNGTGIDISIIATNQSGNWFVSYNVSALGEGKQGVRIFANDTVNNLNNSFVINFSVDFSPPNVTKITPSDYQVFNISANNQTFNTSIFDSATAVENVYFWFDNGTGQDFNVSATNQSGNWVASYNVSGLGKGQQGVRIIANDTVSNLNNSFTINFTVDNAPKISILDLNTTNLRTNDTNTNITAYANATDADSDAVKFIYNWNVNGTPITILNMPFEGGSLSGPVAGLGNATKDYSLFSNNGSAYNVTWNSTAGHDGKGAYRFESGYVGLPQKLLYNFTGNFTVALWVYYEGGGAQSMISKTTNPGFDGWEFRLAETAVNFNFLSGSGDLNFFGCTTATTVRTWTHFAVVKDQNGTLFYKNGQRFCNSTAYAAVSPSRAPLRIGNNFGTLDYFNGSIDDVFIFNKSLTATQIQALYTNLSLFHSNETTVGENWSVDVIPNDGLADGERVSSSNVTILDIETTPPVVTIVNPASNITNYSTGNILFNATISEANIGSVNFSFDNASGNDFNITVTNASGTYSTTQAGTVFTEGRNIMRVFATDNVGNLNSSVTVNFTIDYTPPNVTLNFFNNPVNGSNYSILSSNQTFNASVFDSVLLVDTVYFWFDNGTGQDFNVTGVNSSGSWSISYNVSTLGEGKQGVRVVANDTVNNLNNSFVINFTIDFSSPNVSLTTLNGNPVNGSNFSIRSSNQTFNFTIFDLLTQVQSVYFWFDNGTGQDFNITAVNQSGEWIVSWNVSQLGEGRQGIRIRANDTVGNVNNTAFNFTLDLNAPNVTINILNNPTYGANFSNASNNQTFNVSVFDALTLVDNVYFLFDNGSGQDINVSARNMSGEWVASYNVSSLAEERQGVRIIANDTVNNINNSFTLNFTVDLHSPLLFILNSSFTTPDTTPDLWIRVADNFSTNCNCSVFVNNQFNISQMVVNGTNTSITLPTVLAQGAYHAVVNCTDDAGNSVNSSAIYITVDTIAPTVTLTKSGSTETSLTIAIETSSDANACTSNRAGATISGTGASQTLTEVGLNSGTTYSYTVTCTDSGASSGSETKSFTTDSAPAPSPPSSSEGSSGGGGGGGSGSSGGGDVASGEEAQEFVEAGEVTAEVISETNLGDQIAQDESLPGEDNLPSTGQALADPTQAAQEEVIEEPIVNYKEVTVQFTNNADKSIHLKPTIKEELPTFDNEQAILQKLEEKLNRDETTNFAFNRDEVKSRIIRDVKEVITESLPFTSDTAKISEKIEDVISDVSYETVPIIESKFFTTEKIVDTIISTFEEELSSDQSKEELLEKIKEDVTVLIYENLPLPQDQELIKEKIEPEIEEILNEQLPSLQEKKAIVENILVSLEEIIQKDTIEQAQVITFKENVKESVNDILVGELSQVENKEVIIEQIQQRIDDVIERKTPLPQNQDITNEVIHYIESSDLSTSDQSPLIEELTKKITQNLEEEVSITSDPNLFLDKVNEKVDEIVSSEEISLNDKTILSNNIKEHVEEVTKDEISQKIDSQSILQEMVQEAGVILKETSLSIQTQEKILEEINEKIEDTLTDPLLFLEREDLVTKRTQEIVEEYANKENLPPEEKTSLLVQIEAHVEKVLEDSSEKLEAEVVKEEYEKLQLFEREQVKFLSGKAYNVFETGQDETDTTSGITYSADLVDAQLLKTALVDSEEVTIQPGETISKEYVVRSGISIKDTEASLVFSSGDQEVFEKDLQKEEETLIGGAIDLVEDENAIDFYLLLPSSSPADTTVGKVIDAPQIEEATLGQADTYYVEFTLSKDESESIKTSTSSPLAFALQHLLIDTVFKSTGYTELLGPYKVDSGEKALLAQRFLYDHSKYQGTYKVILRVYREDGIVAKHLIQINFDTGEVEFVSSSDENVDGIKSLERSDLTVSVVLDIRNESDNLKTAQITKSQIVPQENKVDSNTKEEKITKEESVPTQESDKSENTLTGYVIAQDEISFSLDGKSYAMIAGFIVLFFFFSLLIVLRHSKLQNVFSSSTKDSKTSSPSSSLKLSTLSKLSSEEKVAAISSELKRLSSEQEVTQKTYSTQRKDKETSTYSRSLNPRVQVINQPPIQRSTQKILSYVEEQLKSLNANDQNSSRPRANVLYSLKKRK